MCSKFFGAPTSSLSKPSQHALKPTSQLIPHLYQICSVEVSLKYKSAVLEIVAANQRKISWSLRSKMLFPFAVSVRIKKFYSPGGGEKHIFAAVERPIVLSDFSFCTEK